MIVETGDQPELEAAGAEEGLAAANADLLQRFEAIADECRADEEELLDADGSQASQFGVRGG